MKTDLGIGAAAYGLGSGLFFVGYALFEVPSNVLMQKYGARAWLTRIMGTWGLVAAAMAFVWNDTSFYVLRFLLGIAEASFTSRAWCFILTQWLPAERPRQGCRGLPCRFGACIGAFRADYGRSPVADSRLRLHGWQWMFLVEGGFSILLCGASWMLLKSRIRDVARLDVRRADDPRGARSLRNRRSAKPSGERIGSDDEAPERSANRLCVLPPLFRDPIDADLRRHLLAADDYPKNGRDLRTSKSVCSTPSRGLSRWSPCTASPCSPPNGASSRPGLLLHSS